MHLVHNAGRLVTKRELLDKVWAGSFVEEGILSVHLRTAKSARGRQSIAALYRNRFAVGISLYRPCHAIGR